MITPPSDVTDEEGNTHPSVANLPLKAIVRIRIPLIRPKVNVEKDDETPDDVDGDAGNSQAAGTARENQRTEH